ncbi:Sugar kinase, ribokinase family [hydrothermal vent metagenome]|uniref:Sugar kinase, ribokinase family n=1 Tax=hydrothermal vent metagenome TaxID=652676 RepID=A0A3B0WE27_9ZZZZ
MSKYDVYGLGNALVDMEFEINDQFLQDNSIDKGVMTLVDENQQHELIEQLDAFDGNKASGGSAANTLIAVSSMGGSSYYSCKVADDELGHFYLNDLKTANVDCNMEGKHKGGITGKCLVMVTPDAERTMHTFLGVSSELSPYEINEDAIKNASYCYLEGYLTTSESGKAANIEARKIAENNGIKTALTFSDPFVVEHFRDGFTETIGSGIDLLFCNEAEALSYTQTNTVDEAIAVIKTFAKTFAITLGAKGAAVYDGSNLISIDVNPVKAVDTNGAGDLFAGAFMYGLTHGKNFEQAGILASKASSIIVSQFGPRLKQAQYQSLV